MKEHRGICPANQMTVIKKATAVVVRSHRASDERLSQRDIQRLMAAPRCALTEPATNACPSETSSS